MRRRTETHLLRQPLPGNRIRLFGDIVTHVLELRRVLAGVTDEERELNLPRDDLVVCVVKPKYRLSYVLPTGGSLVEKMCFYVQQCMVCVFHLRAAPFVEFSISPEVWADVEAKAYCVEPHPLSRPPSTYLIRSREKPLGLVLTRL